MSETIAFLGCSRGIGSHFCRAWDRRFPDSVFHLYARNLGPLEGLAGELDSSAYAHSVDFSKGDQFDEILEKLTEQNPTRVFYFAGGGPHGFFGDKEWKDHQWALNVTLLMPMRLVHALAREDAFPNLMQTLLVGSLVADSAPDPKASSYAVAKHGLRGLVSTLHEEGLPFDLRFLRPGYIDTDLLPPNSWVREAKKLLDPKVVAEKSREWLLEPGGAKILDMPSS
ncbi:MAG: SDR family oxidoreductase [Pseudomonadota bacterium]